MMFALHAPTPMPLAKDRSRTTEVAGLFTAVILSLEESPDLDSMTIEALREFAQFMQTVA